MIIPPLSTNKERGAHLTDLRCLCAVNAFPGHAVSLDRAKKSIVPQPVEAEEMAQNPIEAKENRLTVKGDFSAIEATDRAEYGQYRGAISKMTEYGGVKYLDEGDMDKFAAVKVYSNLRKQRALPEPVDHVALKFKDNEILNTLLVRAPAGPGHHAPRQAAAVGVRLDRLVPAESCHRGHPRQAHNAQFLPRILGVVFLPVDCQLNEVGAKILCLLTNSHPQLRHVLAGKMSDALIKLLLVEMARSVVGKVNFASPDMDWLHQPSQHKQAVGSCCATSSTACTAASTARLS